MAKETRNQAIWLDRRRAANSNFESFAKLSSAAPMTDKRTVIFAAVEQQLAHDEKRPFALSQKLNDAPYRYTRDALWAAVNSISRNLQSLSPPIDFPTEGKFRGKEGFSAFINGRLSGTVSALISKIVENARWG